MTHDQSPITWATILGPCYTTASFSRALGWTETEVREAAASLSVLELTTADDALLYPAFQLWNGGVVAGLDAVLRELRTGTKSPWTWAQWLNTQVDDESGEEASNAIEQLRAGQLDSVLRDARHTAWAWSN